jgi:hypothetical protein
MTIAFAAPIVSIAQLSGSQPRSFFDPFSEQIHFLFVHHPLRHLFPDDSFDALDQFNVVLCHYGDRFA